MRPHPVLLCTALLAAPLVFGADTPQTLLDAVNQARAQTRQCGSRHFPAAPPLQWHDGLAAVAAEHAGDMAAHNYFSHTDRQGRTAHQRIQAAIGHPGAASAENISAGSRTAVQAMAGWLKSPGHCRNIMNPQHTHFGMAAAVNPGSRYHTYWVQTFSYQAY